VAGDLLRQLLGGLPQPLGRVDDLGDHPQLVGPLGGHALVPADEGHPHHRLDRHLAHEPDALDGHDLAHRDVGVEELGVGGGDDDVGVGHPVEGPAGADAVDRGDDRLPDALVPGGEVQVPLLQRPPVALHADAVGGDLLHVDAGLEGAALAGVDDHPHGRVAVELDPGVGQLLAHAGVHGVELLGPVEDQPAHRAVALDLQGLVAHPRAPAGSSGCQTGSRRSTKARGPSTWSGWPHIDTSSRAPLRHASVRPVSSAPHSARLVAAMAAGELRATFSASSRAASRSRSGSTTSLRMPSWRARSAVMRSWRPVSAMRTIGSIGDMRTRAMVSKALTWPTDTWGSRNVASVEAMTMSASATKWSPPPAQAPLTAAITG